MNKWWLLVPILLIGSGLLWANSASQPMQEVESYLTSNDQVQVQTGKVLAFEPQGQAAMTGLIFYPGGRVEPEAYAPLAWANAQKGYPTYIVPMPINLAVLDYNAATQVMEAHPEVSNWVMGGHSLGGAMAAHYLYKFPDQIAGLVLLAAYPPSKDDLSTYQGQVVSIYGSKDGLATPEKVAPSRELLPPDTRWVEIVGGNHSQFGWYGFQSGDQPAEITREEQQQIILDALTDLMASINRGE